ncbi:fluoride efflux transporter CrcB [Brevibacillus ruminantium]|uniref:Fluoride-specific ion channel FluC n=1 Tax=Brevibacillus ruminantium TaxID=2950604 RepID=A0ABY4WLP0_9BACL|nr:fluoride efflux transporter CrcB [Brevibacillus ruminantium]USG68052.1 fluoride efflux transporter CrcB [Brevibacillus ruminantium]
MLSWVAVAVGGAIGSMLRYGLGFVLNQPGIPAGTWLANVLGSFVIGLFSIWGKEKGLLPAEMYLLLTTGLLGGFTTFSTFSLEVVTFLSEGQISRGIVYAGSSILLGLCACALGIWVGRQLLT